MCSFSSYSFNFIVFWFKVKFTLHDDSLFTLKNYQSHEFLKSPEWFCQVMLGEIVSLEFGDTPPISLSLSHSLFLLTQHLTHSELVRKRHVYFCGGSLRRRADDLRTETWER